MEVKELTRGEMHLLVCEKKGLFQSDPNMAVEYKNRYQGSDDKYHYIRTIDFQ